MLEPATIALLITTSGATIYAITKLFYLSKCDRVSICWGCYTHHRRTQDEQQIQIENPSSPTRV